MAPYSSKNEGECMINIVKAQDDCVSNSLGMAIRHLLNKPIKTMVLPLALPTGFGKTRIAIQGIMRTKFKNKSINASVVLWPQKKSHVKETWMSKMNWVKSKDLNKIDPDEKKDSKKDPLAWHWHHLTEKANQKTRNVFKEEKKRLFYVLDGDNWINSKKAYENLSLKERHLFFIIDEWHGKNLIKKFQNYKSEIASPEKRAERFWRETLLPKQMWNSSTKVFVLLVSATPISTTSDMDERNDGKIVDDEDFASYIKSCYDSFVLLSRVGYSTGNYNFLNNSYNKLIKDEVAKLDYSERPAQTANDRIYCEAKQYLASYFDIVKNIVGDNKGENTLVYLDEQKRFLDEKQDPQLLKLKALCDLIGKAYSKKKFVVFCHYKEGVAERVEKFLKKNLDNGEECVYYTRPRKDGEPPRMSEKDAKKRFNDPKNRLRVLIVTDRDSQGIDLHKSKAYLVHYELAWNPIRIIQRFGRVWRIIRRKYKTRPRNGQKAKWVKKTEMTCPRAFYLPFTYSSEEEQINRLRRRWEFLESLDEEMSSEKVKKNQAAMSFAAIPFKIALGTRWTPEPDANAK